MSINHPSIRDESKPKTAIDFLKYAGLLITPQNLFILGMYLDTGMDYVQFPDSDCKSMDGYYAYELPNEPESFQVYHDGVMDANKRHEEMSKL